MTRNNLNTWFPSLVRRRSIRLCFIVACALGAASLFGIASLMFRLVGVLLVGVDLSADLPLEEGFILSRSMMTIGYLEVVVERGVRGMMQRVNGRWALFFRRGRRWMQWDGMWDAKKGGCCVCDTMTNAFLERKI